MCAVALIIFVPGIASSSVTVSNYKVFKLYIQEMRLVALIILVPGTASFSPARVPPSSLASLFVASPLSLCRSFHSRRFQFFSHASPSPLPPSRLPLFLSLDFSFPARSLSNSKTNMGAATNKMTRRGVMGCALCKTVVRGDVARVTGVIQNVITNAHQTQRAIMFCFTLEN